MSACSQPITNNNITRHILFVRIPTALQKRLLAPLEVCTVSWAIVVAPGDLPGSHFAIFFAKRGPLLTGLVNLAIVIIICELHPGQPAIGYFRHPGTNLAKNLLYLPLARVPAR